MKEIESKNNPIIKRALKAINEPNKENLILVEGFKLFGEALKSGAKPEMIFLKTKNLFTKHLNLPPLSMEKVVFIKSAVA